MVAPASVTTSVGAPASVVAGVAASSADPDSASQSRSVPLSPTTAMPVTRGEPGPARISSSAIRSQVSRLCSDSPDPSAITIPAVGMPSSRSSTSWTSVTASARAEPEKRLPMSLRSISAVVLSE